MSKQTETAERTKSNLSDAFWQLYCHNDISKISIKNITDKAGYNRSTFYQYFTDINDVLGRIEDSVIGNIAENVSEILSSENEDDWMSRIIEMYDEKSGYLSVLLGENGDPTFLDKLKAVMRPIYISKAKLGNDDFRANMALEFTIAGSLACIIYWHGQNKPVPAKEAVAIVRSIMKTGTL